MLPSGKNETYAPSTTTEGTEQNEADRGTVIYNQGQEHLRPIPSLSPEDIRTAQSIMHGNRGGYRCWGCREMDHDLYNCPYLPSSVRTLFAKANFDYQAEIKGQTGAHDTFRLRGRGRGNPSHRGQTRGVTIASPPVASTHSPKQVLFNPSRKAKPIFVTGEANVEDHVDDGTSSSSGN